ncbi:MAG: secondary thiamine-phosphate synthase enzyme YjbQ [Rhodothermia bacterium]|nr:secondary thiamine-phosphate synthase enzyme YjbQ [Rhodothermia bacterium]
MPTEWRQYVLTLKPRARGYHLVTREIVSQLDDIRKFRIGVAHLFLQHTSASLTLNENASPDVRSDFSRFFDRLVPDGANYFDHTIEGPDDMPAHIKASLTGSSLTIPIANGRLSLGTWQGIYLCEHRDSGGPRRITVTIQGETD